MDGDKAVEREHPEYKAPALRRGTSVAVQLLRLGVA